MIIFHYDQLCESPTSADVQSYALDELLEAILDNAKSDQEKINALDYGFFIFILFLFYFFSQFLLKPSV